MPKTIQELRKEAGYRSGREFAAVLGVSPSTYSRYEASPDSIPLKAAWAMADLLGCSIDVIVGREHVEVSDMRGEVQKIYDDLSPQSQYLMDDYLEYLVMRDEAAEQRRQEEEDRKYREYAEYYERLFLQSEEDDSAFGEMATFGSQEKTRARASFEDFIRERAAKKRESDMEQRSFDYRLDLTQGYHGPVFDEHGEMVDVIDEPPVEDEEELERLVDEYRTSTLAKWEERDEEVIEKIMAAYDKIHLQTRLPMFDRPGAVALEYLPERPRP